MFFVALTSINQGYLGLEKKVELSFCVAHVFANLHGPLHDSGPQKALPIFSLDRYE